MSPWRRTAAWSALIAGALALAACGDDVPSTLQTGGPHAASIAWLWWLMLGLATVVFAVVCLLWLAAGRGWRPRGPAWLAQPGESMVVFWGIGVTGVVLAVVMGATLVSGAQTYRPPEEPVTVIEVIGHQYWWEVRYDDGEVTTANEITIPTGQPVVFRLTTNDVIHSFWIPELAGKMDMIPGRVNDLWVQADEAGTFRGICAEFCGIQHAQMHMVVHAVDDAEFTAWLDDQREDVPEPETAATRAGREVFESAACIECHGLTGVREATSAGPDLSNLASRDTIGAGFHPNDRETLEQWILDPHELKPGVLMPSVDLDSDDLDALLDYLETLQ